MDTEPRAVVKEVNGQLILDDPDAHAMAKAIDKLNCKTTLNLSADQVAHYQKRAVELSHTPETIVIAIIHVDDNHGGPLAETLMPNGNWQEFRDRKEKPLLRGLVGREFMQDALRFFDQEAADKLRTMQELAVVVIDFNVAEVFTA